MEAISNGIKLLCGISLFLFGMSLMGTGLKRVAGDKLEMFLYKMTNNPIKGILLGTFVTLVIQSSSATTVMVVGFVNSGMMQVAQAIGVIMGANIGTSITGWILCLSYVGGTSGVAALFSTATISGVVAVIGIILYMFNKQQSRKNVGMILLGFTILMTGMQSMSGAVSSVKDSEMFLNAMTMFSNPFVGILIGIAFTAVLQSASASVGILQALSLTGAISFDVAFPIILGIGVGASCPVLLSAIGTNRDGQRTALVYLLDDMLGMVIWGSIFYLVNAIVGGFEFMPMTMNPVSIALLNTIYRVLTVLVLSPFIKQIEKLVRILIKDRPEDIEARADFELMEERFLAYPAVAIEHSSQVANTMVKKAWNNVQRAVTLLWHYDPEIYDTILMKDADIDKYNSKLSSFLTKLMSGRLSDSQTKDVAGIFHGLNEFKRIGDHAVNIANHVNNMNQNQVEFSDAGKKDLACLNDLIGDIVDSAVKSFENNDVIVANEVHRRFEQVEAVCAELRRKHLKRIKKGKCSVTATQYFDSITVDLERIAVACDYIATNIIEQSN